MGAIVDVSRCRSLNAMGPAVVVVATTLVAATACSSAGNADRALTTMRDSAGITIAEGPAVDASVLPQWRLADAPSVTIGVLEGPPEQQLYRVAGAVRMRDGRIAVANAGSSEIRFFSPDGTFLRATGGQGDGPGEFRFMSQIVHTATDSLLVWDVMGSRLTVLSSDGAFVRTTPLDPPDADSRATFGSAFADGSLLALVSSSAGREPPDNHGVLREERTLMRASSTGQPLDSLVTIQRAPTFVTKGSAEGSAMMVYLTRIPFATSGSWAVRGNTVLEGDGTTYEVRTRTHDGQLVEILRRAHRPAPVTDEIEAAYRTERVERSEDPAARRKAEATFAAMPLPETIAAFDDLEVDAQGNLWVRRVPLPGSDTFEFDVFDASGTPIATAVLPGDVIVFEIGDGYLLGRVRDELDVEQVVVFPIEKTLPGSEDGAGSLEAE